MEQMTIRSVDLDPFESNFGSPAGGRCKVVAHALLAKRRVMPAVRPHGNPLR